MKSTMERLNQPSPYNYFYPDTEVLKNKYWIRDPKALEVRCAHDTTKAIVNLCQEPAPNKFDSNYLKYIHERLFQNTFEWAGHTRDVPFTFSFDGTVAIMPGMKKVGAKTHFAKSDEIQDGLRKLESTLSEQNNLQGLSRKDFADSSAELFSLLNHIHPFREGNGRTQRMFFVKLAESAGHKLDFSLVTVERMTRVCAMVEEYGDLGPMKHMFEDISNPEKGLLLEEAIDYIEKFYGERLHSRLIMVAKEGETYTGIYKGASAESFVIEDREASPSADPSLQTDGLGAYVVGKKEHLTPEQLKTLQIGDMVTFTAPKIFIPKEVKPPLTKKEVSETLMKDTVIQAQKKEAQRLSKIVYGRSGTLDKEMDQLISDPKLGENLAEKIAHSPQSIAKLAGFKIFGITNRERTCAEESVPKLSKAVERYVHSVRFLEKKLIQDHEAEQSRIAQEITMPSQTLQHILAMPQEERLEALTSSPELKRDLGEFVKKVQARLSPSEHMAVKENDYGKLSESLGISKDQAKGVIDLVKQSREAYQQIQALAVDHSQTMAMTR